MAAIVLLLIIGIAAIAVLNFNSLQGKAASFVATNSLQQRKIPTKPKSKHKPNYNMKQVNPVSPGSLAHAWHVRRDYRAVGQIAIPSQNILLNIYLGSGNVELNLGCGTMRADQKMGRNNYPLAGHNMDDGSSYFSPLYTAKVNGQLAKGTKIYLTDFKKVYYYKLITAYFVGSYNLLLAFNQPEFRNKPVISLFTCDWTGQGRLFVRGRLTGSQSLRGATKYVRSVFRY